MERHYWDIQSAALAIVHSVIGWSCYTHYNNAMDEWQAYQVARLKPDFTTESLYEDWKSITNVSRIATCFSLALAALLLCYALLESKVIATLIFLLSMIQYYYINQIINTLKFRYEDTISTNLEKPIQYLYAALDYLISTRRKIIGLIFAQFVSVFTFGAFTFFSAMKLKKIKEEEEDDDEKLKIPEKYDEKLENYDDNSDSDYE